MLTDKKVLTCKLRQSFSMDSNPMEKQVKNLGSHSIALEPQVARCLSTLGGITPKVIRDSIHFIVTPIQKEKEKNHG